MDGWSIVIGILGGVASLATVVVLFLKSRGENQTALSSTKNLLDARIDARVSEQLEGAWQKIDAMSLQIDNLEDRETRRSGAITRILRDIARQWPGIEGPNLNPSDIAEIEETIPSSWIRRSPSTPS